MMIIVIVIVVVIIMIIMLIIIIIVIVRRRSARRARGRGASRATSGTGRAPRPYTNYDNIIIIIKMMIIHIASTDTLYVRSLSYRHHTDTYNKDSGTGRAPCSHD